MLKVLDLKKAKINQAKEIADLKKKVKKLERKKKSRNSGLKRLWKVGSTTRVESSEDKESLGDQGDASKKGRMIDNIDQNKEITLVDETQERMNEEKMFRVNDLDGDKVIMDDTTGEEVKHSTKVAKKEVSTADPVTTADELTLAQTLIEIKAAKPKARGVMVQEPSEFRTTSSSQPSLLQDKDKGKGIMVEPEKPLKKKDQIEFDEKVTRKPEAQMNAEMEDFEEVQKSFNNTMSWINSFVPMEKDRAEGNEHVEGEVDNDQREAEMKMYIKIIHDDEIAIDAIPLATKPLIIVDWKIIKEGKISSYHLIRADGSSKRYSSTIQML
uniref:Uncharacterized protein n=1 Tax=Tanacetum cinerariifolium TaxID=118510 RepID=A0A699HN37_TANCI|nr:hypothetical protein [Tanacetum cinerariifolium]